MANKAKHAYGSRANLATAIETGKVDAYDILFLNGENESPAIGWVDRDGNPVIVSGEEYVVRVTELPTANGKEGVVYIYDNEAYIWDGEQCTSICKPTDVSALEAKIATKADAKDVDEKIEIAKAYTDGKIEAAVNEHLLKKYEITSKPVGTLVDYFDKEIRVMCPVDTVWTKQNVGETGNANMYYMGFKAYAPEGAVGFKEGDQGVIKDEYFDFTGDFAGTDEFGRNYSIVWLALASCDEAGTWTYFGKNSTTEKYIGWTYVVEWYNADGVIIDSDAVRINLSNEDCYNTIEPYYMSNALKIAKEYTDAQIETKIAEVEGAIEVVEF